MTAEDPIIEEVEITGHIIDSLILPKVLDTITANGGKPKSVTRLFQLVALRFGKGAGGATVSRAWLGGVAGFGGAAATASSRC